MPITEDVDKIIKCCLKSDTAEHYVYDAVILPCGGNACKKCITDLDEESEEDEGDDDGDDNDDDDESTANIKCKFCDGEHDMDDLLEMTSNPSIKPLIEAYMVDLKKKLLKELEETSESFKDDNISEQLNLRFENIELEMDIQIESIIEGLHGFRNNFKKEMLAIKNRFEERLQKYDFKKFKMQLNDIEKNPNKVDYYETFMKTHALINKSKKVLQDYVNELNQIKFRQNQEIVYKDLVGYIEMPYWKKLIESKTIPIDDAKNLSCLAYSNDENLVYLSDPKESALFIHYIDDDTVGKWTHETLGNPTALCVGVDDQLFVFDDTDYNKVVVIQPHLKYKGLFPINDGCVTQMKVDLHGKENILYLTHHELNKVTVLNGDEEHLIETIEIETPHCIEFSENFIYIASSLFLPLPHDDQENKQELLSSGSNCIFMLNKVNYAIMEKIQFDNWLQPFGLAIDEQQNILTIAYELDYNKIISRNTYLHVINSNKEIVSKVKLEDEGDSYDMVFCEDTLLILYEKSIKSIQFENYS